MLELSLPHDRLRDFVRAVVETNFPDGTEHDFELPLTNALRRIERNFTAVALPGYKKNGNPYFNHRHGDQSAVFWYFFSNSAFQLGDRDLAEKAMLVNKSRNGIIIMYDTALPDHMLLIHAVGTMLGKATYGDFLVVTQNVTVGTHRGNAPVLGNGTILYPKSFIAGNSVLGNFCRLAVGTVAIDVTAPDRSIISGVFPEQIVRPSKRETIAEYFKPVPAFG